MVGLLDNLVQLFVSICIKHSVGVKSGIIMIDQKYHGYGIKISFNHNLPAATIRRNHGAD